jgi:predicted O-methyltransferase YrrM
MDSALRDLLDELYADGVAFDATQDDRLLTRRNLEPASAGLLWSLVQIAGVRNAIEIGTSNGYSTIWLADALTRTGGRLTSVDVAPDPAAEANLVRAGRRETVRLHRGDGGRFLAGLPDACVDLLFLDAERTEYPRWWPHPLRVLRPGGVMAIDNVLSHPTEVAEFLSLLDDQPGIEGRTIDIGKGLHLAWRDLRL